MKYKQVNDEGYCDEVFTKFRLRNSSHEQISDKLYDVLYGRIAWSLGNILCLSLTEYEV